jgi:hypothetical protein
LFSTRTHAALFNPKLSDDVDGTSAVQWSKRHGLAALAVGGVLVTFVGDVVANSISAAGQTLSISQFFLAFVVVGAVGAISTIRSPKLQTIEWTCDEYRPGQQPRKPRSSLHRSSSSRPS